MGSGMEAMAWASIIHQAGRFDPALLNLAFVFLLVGYGTKVGLAPLHAWLPDAHAEGPTPISAVLSGLLLNVALYAVLRFKMLLAANTGALTPGPMMITMGLSSLLLASFMLYRRRDVKRLFAYSSIEHRASSPSPSAWAGRWRIFRAAAHDHAQPGQIRHLLAVGHITQVKGTQRIGDIRGLTASHPALGWGFLIGVVAISGLPPLGIFMSEFLVVTSTMARIPWLALPLVLGLLVSFGALILRLQGMAFGAPSAVPHKRIVASLAPLWAHLSLVLVAGLHLPGPLVVWFQNVARLLG